MGSYLITQTWKHVEHCPTMYACALPETPKGGVAWTADRAKALRLTMGQAVRHATRNCAKIEPEKTLGQLAYEEDIRREPNYPFGNKPRDPWDKLSDIARQSWERNPTPRAKG